MLFIFPSYYSHLTSHSATPLQPPPTTTHTNCHNQYHNHSQPPPSCCTLLGVVGFGGTKGQEGLFQFLKKLKSVKPYEIGRKIGYQLSKYWDMAMLVIYLDGEQSDQMLKARTARGIVRDKNMRELESLLGKIETHSINGKWTPKSIVSTIKKRLGSVYSITDAFKDELQRDLFTVKEKVKVLATLGFQHPRQPVLYGTVSRNDYVANIRTIGLGKNRDIIRDLIVDWNADMDVLLEAYLLEANSRVAVDDRVDKGHFRHSIAMFFDLRLTYDEKPPSVTNMQYMEISLKFSHLKALRVERKSEQPRSAPKFYIAPGSKPNQYRPTFGSKDIILGSGTRAFRVCDTKGRRMPEPRKGPKTKRGKQEVKYQRTQNPAKRKNRVPKEGEPTYEARHKNKLKSSTVGLANLEKELRIHEVEQEDTLIDNSNAEQEDKQERNPDARVLSTSLSDAIGTIQVLRIRLYEVWPSIWIASLDQSSRQEPSQSSCKPQASPVAPLNLWLISYPPLRRLF
ncbi:MAG: hypothetical protein J3R72DRAFT_503178 [Linnemannia gamsii]|nr:MAG: hypothetical protein J3R72DRAFT_503178 [Linnemannia gamsii]